MTDNQIETYRGDCLSTAGTLLSLKELQRLETLQQRILSRLEWVETDDGRLYDLISHFVSWASFPAGQAYRAAALLLAAYYEIRAEHGYKVREAAIEEALERALARTEPGWQDFRELAEEELR